MLIVLKIVNVTYSILGKKSKIFFMKAKIHQISLKLIVMVVSQKKPDIITNTFNEYFANVGPNLAKKDKKDDGNSTMYINQVVDSIFLSPTKETEIINIVKSLSGNKSPGYDEVSPSVLKSIIVRIVTPLVRMMISCQFVIIDCFFKSLRKVMFKRISIFIENHAILSTCQFGFREHHSTSMALTKLVDKITHELDKKCYYVGIFLDLSKAFETIDHNILIKKYVRRISIA